MDRATAQELKEIGEQMNPGIKERAPLSSLKTRVGVLVENVTYRRLVESASMHLELMPVHLDGGMLNVDGLIDLDLIVADEPIARDIRTRLAARESRGEGVNPAVVAVMDQRLQDVKPLAIEPHSFDGMLLLPQAPGPLAAQMSLILYSHRAFAKRYETAIEELHLNRRIFRSVTSGICVVNALLPDMPITYVNPAFEVMTGFGLEEVLGKNCRFLQGEERDQPALTLIREALRDQRETVAILKNFRKDGTPFWNELSLSPIRSRDGELTHFVGIQNDVTARVEFEAALRESEKLAAVGRLAASIAHEINNPLEAVMNLVYITERLDISNEAKAHLASIDQQLRRVKLITSQSLRFYKQSTKAQATDCPELLDTVLDLYQARLTNAKVSVIRRYRSTQSIICMESEIGQALSNLIANAIDSMRGHGGALHLRTCEATAWQSGTKGVRVTVADSGSGISKEVLKDIYKAFFTTKGITGSGLGLWISGEIVSRHQGTIRVRSRTQQGSSGTVFAVFLPLQGVSP